MSDQNKTKAELITELNALRRRVAQLESGAADAETKETETPPDISQNVLHRLIQQLPIGVQIFDTNGLCIDVNEAHMKTFGVNSRETVVGRFNIFVVPTLAQPRARLAAQKALEGETIHLPEMEFDFSQADPHFTGNRGNRTISVTFFPIKNAKGEVVQIVALNEDVTERKQTAAAFVESQERYRRLVDLLPDGITVHQEEKIVFANPAAAHILGANSPEEIIDKSTFDFVHPHSKELVEQRQKRWAKNKKPRQI